MDKRILLGIVVALLLTLPAAADTTFKGTLYYTYYTGGQNVWSVGFNYDQTLHIATLGVPHNIASTSGADGIIFAPNGNLLVAGQGTPQVHEITTGGAPVTDFSTCQIGVGCSQTYHLALSPNGQLVYTSNFMGPLVTINLGTNTATINSISGSPNSGLTQIAFAPNGNVFYVDGNPNGGGQVGLLNLGTDTASPLFGGNGITPAHGLIYDPYTGLMTMFGAGYTGTFDQSGTAGSLKISGQLNYDFDQGAVDGQGHALVAGNGQITFIDYSGSHDITNPNYVQYFGGFVGIDDVAPLVGPGSQQGTAPEPSSLVLFGSGILGAAGALRRKLLG